MAIKYPLVNIRQAINGDWEQVNVVEAITVPSSSPYEVYLTEVPDNGDHNTPVTISGLTETTVYPPTTGRFYVNYGNGHIAFHSDQAGQSLSADYWKKGSLVEAEDINYLYDSIVELSAGAGTDVVSAALTAHIADYSGTVHADPTTLLQTSYGHQYLSGGAIPLGIAGEVYWNDSAHTLNIVTGLGNSIQVGQENFGVGVNKTGVDIAPTEFRVVYQSDIDTNKMLFEFADAREKNKCFFIGTTTAGIANNTEGPITTFGMVNNVDTSAWEEGDWLYVAADATGIPVNQDNIPQYPNHQQFVGVVVKKNANTGAVFVMPQHEYHEWFARNESRTEFLSATLSGHINDYSPTVHADPVTGLQSSYGHQFMTGGTPQGLSGELYWDAENHTLSLDTGLGNIIQIGQEMFGVGRNQTGDTVTDAMVVYMSGATGGVPNFGLADASDAVDVERSGNLGVVTTTINNNATGPVTTFGLVRNLNTNDPYGGGEQNWSEGDKLYITTDGSGQLTNTPPVYPDHVVWVATVLRDHSTEGTIFVRPVHDYHDRDDHAEAQIISLSATVSGGYVPNKTLEDNHVPAGYLDYTTSALSLIENDGATDTFTATISGTDFPVYLDGHLQYLSTQSVTVVNAQSHRYYIYFDADGVLQYSADEWFLSPSEGFAGEAPTCTVLWDATNHQGIIEEERHHSWRDVNWHHWAHHSVGPRYSFGHTADGLALSNPNVDEYQTFQILEGEIYDEDIRNDCPTTSAGYLFYHTGDGTMVWEPTTQPYKTVGGIAQYDNGTGLADKINSNTLGYFVTWVYTTNSVSDDYKVAFIVGQDTDNEMTYEEAVAASLPTLPVDFIVEWRLAWKMIFRRGNTGTITHIENEDYRSAGSLPGGSVQSSNIAAAAVSFSPAGTIASTNVQTAIEELDTQQQAISAAASVHYSISSSPPNSATAYYGQQWYDSDIGVVYAWDSRDKWVSTNRTMFAFGSKDTPQNQYLNFYASGLVSSLSGLRLLRDAVITGITVQSTSSTTFDIQIRKNGVATALYTANLVATDNYVDGSVDVNLDAADKLQVYLSSAGTIAQPMVLIEVAWRQ